MDVILVIAPLDRSLVRIIHVIKQQLAIMVAPHITKEILSLVLMDVILVLALLDRSLVRITHVNKHAIIKAVHTMTETHSLAWMDVILVIALLEMSLVQIIHVTKQLLAYTKAKLIMKEIHSFLRMVLNLVLALQARSSVLI